MVEFTKPGGLPASNVVVLAVRVDMLSAAVMLTGSWDVTPHTEMLWQPFVA